MKSVGGRKLRRTVLAAFVVLQCTLVTRITVSWRAFEPAAVTEPDSGSSGESFWRIISARSLMARIEEARLCFQLWYEVLNEADVLTRRKTFTSMEEILEEREPGSM